MTSTSYATVEAIKTRGAQNMLEEDEGDGTVQGVAVLVQYVKNIKIMRGEP